MAFLNHPAGHSDSDLSKSVSGILDLRVGSDQKMMEAITELSKFPTQSGLHLCPLERKSHRPDLKTLIENQHITAYKNFLISFKEIKSGVSVLHQELSQLNGVCELMTKNLWMSKENSRNLIDEIAKLEGERKKLVRERDLALAYLNAFQLDAEDLKILRSTESSGDILTAEFFKVFEKIQKIQSNVSVLLKIGHQTTAVEIMDQMGLFQESALEKIYRWAQSHCKNVENPLLAEALTKSLAYLQIRPMLLKYVLDEYCANRRSLVVRSYIDALTGVGNIKGIELVGCSDPVRYIADMLAWIHQSIPGEKENLSILLKACDTIDKDEKIIGCLSTIMDGVCRPLNVRMEQTILSGLDCALMNKIDLRIGFYVQTIEQVIPNSQLLVTLKEMYSLCHQTFINQLKAQIHSELGEYRPPGPDLQPPTSITALLNVLRDLIHDTATSSPEQTQTLIHMLVTPLVGQINDVANRLGSPDMGVYLSNCLNQINVFLEMYPNTEAIVKALKGQIEMQIDRLSSEQSSWLVAQLGIGHIYTILHEKLNEPLSTVPGMDSASLKIFVNKLDTLINDPDSALLPQIIHISDPLIKKTIMRQSFRILVAIYKQVYDAVIDPNNQYPKDLLGLEPSKLEDSLCA